MTLTPFQQEIAGQPAALAALTAFYRGAGRALLAAWVEAARTAGRVTFAGSGTSEHTPHIALQALAAAGVPAESIDAGELLHYPRPISGALALVSQSGESVEARQLAVRHAGTTLIGVTNDPNSTLGRSAGLVLPMCGGVETTITTKTYSNSLALFALLARALEGDGAVDATLDALDGLATAIATVDEAGIARAADLLADAKALHMIARGPAVAAARQAALTFMEGTRISATAFPAGSFRHGPFELADAAHRAILYIPAAGRTHELMANLAAELAGKGSRVIAISDGPLALPADTCRVVRVPAAKELLFPVAAAVTQARLLDAVAARVGLVAGAFRYSGKITLTE